MRRRGSAEQGRGLVCQICRDRSMKPSVIAAALLALASCTPQPAVADMYLTPHGVQRVDLPPERFRKQGVSLVRFVENITKVCGRHAQSCAAGTVVVMPDPCGYAPEAYAAYLCRNTARRKVI